MEVNLINPHFLLPGDLFPGLLPWLPCLQSRVARVTVALLVVLDQNLVSSA